MSCAFSLLLLFFIPSALLVVFIAMLLVSCLLLHLCLVHVRCSRIEETNKQELPFDVEVENLEEVQDETPQILSNSTR